MDEMNRIMLRARLEGLLMQRGRLDEAIELTRKELGGDQELNLVAINQRYTTGDPSNPIPDIHPIKPSKKVLSEEARARIAAAQKRRWAAVKKAKR